MNALSVNNLFIYFWIYRYCFLIFFFFVDKNVKPKGKTGADEPVESEIQNMEDESEFFSSKKMKEENKKKISGTW